MRESVGILPSTTTVKNWALVGRSGHGSARGPPTSRAELGRCGASAQRSTITSAAMTVILTDATTFVARASAGLPRELSTTSDSRRSWRCALMAYLNAASEGSERHPSRFAYDGRWTNGAASDLAHGNYEVKRCSHFKAALPERDTSRPSSW
jgi:hypothetical protein